MIMRIQSENPLKYYAVSSGEVFRCIQQTDAKSAAALALCEQFATGVDVGLSDIVEVACEDGQRFTFDPQELMAEAGGIALADKVSLETVREFWELPDEVGHAFEKAWQLLVRHHIREKHGIELDECDAIELTEQVIRRSCEGVVVTRLVVCDEFQEMVAEWDSAKLTRYGICAPHAFIPE